MKLEVGKLYYSDTIHLLLHTNPEKGQIGFLYNISYAGMWPPHIPKGCSFLVLKISKYWNVSYAQILYKEQAWWITRYDLNPNFLRELKAV